MNEKKMAANKKTLRLMLAGLLVIIAGNILMMGGGVTDPNEFNFDMFDFQRLVAAPIVILSGIVTIIIAIINTK